MEEITVRTDPKDLEAVYLEAHELTHQATQVNNALDTLDPILDALNSALDMQEIKRTRFRNKINRIMAKM